MTNIQKVLSIIVSVLIVFNIYVGFKIYTTEKKLNETATLLAEVVNFLNQAISNQPK